jgi:hypothetical protein
MDITRSGLQNRSYAYNIKGAGNTVPEFNQALGWEGLNCN